MKIFNLENAPKGKPAAKTECVVIATWEEWIEIIAAIDTQVKLSPRKKKLKAIKDALDNHLAVF